MSFVKKAVKKVFKPVKKAFKKVVKEAKRFVKSDLFKVVAVAAVAYFGGAALMSVMGGGTASAGLGSAWAGLKGAGSALMAGNFSGAASAIGSGFTGGATAGASAGFTAGMNSTAATISGGSNALSGAATANALNVATPTASELASQGAAQMTGSLVQGAGYTSNAVSSLSSGLNSTNAIANSALNTVGTEVAKQSSGGLLSSAWNGLGEYGKAAVVNGGISLAGNMIAGNAQDTAEEEARKRRTYYGMDGEGQTGGLMNFDLPHMPLQGKVIPPSTSWQTTLDDLINRQKQVVGGY